MEKPKHYNIKIDPRDYITVNNLDFNEGNIIKYISRYKEKNGLGDLLKAKNYLNYLIEKEIEKKKNNLILFKILDNIKMDNLGHVKLFILRDFILKHKQFFNQRKIKTLKKKEALDVIEKKLNEFSPSMLKEWRLIKVKPNTVRGLKSNPSPSGSKAPARKKRGSQRPEEAKPSTRLLKLERMSVKPTTRLQKLDRQTIEEGIPPPRKRK